MINPGNPTGSILSADTIKAVLEFAVKNKIVVVADEVRMQIYRCIVRIFTKKMLALYHLEKFCKP